MTLLAERRKSRKIFYSCALFTTFFFSQANSDSLLAQATSNPRPKTAQQAPVSSRPATSASKPSDSPELSDAEKTKLQAALDAFNQQDFATALANLRDIAANNPAARPARVVVANWFSELQNSQAVKLSLEMATEESPDDPEAYYLLAEIALREGQLTAAELLTVKGDEKLATYKANPKRAQNMTKASYTLKLAYSNARQRWADAQNAILGLIKVEGESPDLDRAYARALFQQGQEEKARQFFQRANGLEPTDQKSQTLPVDAEMSQLYAARGDLEMAKKTLNDALKANPKSPRVLLLSISLALSENELDNAQQLVQQLYAEDKSVETLKTYGKVALFRSDYSRAEAAFQEVVRQNPLDADAASGLALALCEQGDAEKCKRAVQYAASNLQKQSNNRDFLATLGWVLYKSGQVDEAFKVLQQSIADGQINAASAYYLAVILNEKGQSDTARQLLVAALGTRPPFAKRAAAEKLLAELQTPRQTNATPTTAATSAKIAATPKRPASPTRTAAQPKQTRR